MSDFLTYYDVLEVPRSATPEEIKAAFRKLSLQYHPDHNEKATDRIKQLAGKKFSELLGAYTILKDTDLRTQYDSKLKEREERERQAKQPPRAHASSTASPPRQKQTHSQTHSSPPSPPPSGFATYQPSGTRSASAKKRKTTKWVGIILVLVAIGFGWNILASIFANNVTTLTQDLSQGMRGGEVSDLQRQLTAASVYTGPITGYFGDATEEAVKRYQRTHGINPTGFVGPATRASLNGTAVATTYEVRNVQSPSPAPTTSTSGAKKAPIAPAPKPGVDPIIVRDQFGHAVANAHIWLVDSEARKYPSGGWYVYWETDENGRREFEYSPGGRKGDIPDGHYTIHIEKQNYTTVEFPIESTTDEARKYSSFFPNTFILPKQGIIAAVVVDTDGKPITNGRFTLVDSQGKTMASGEAIQTGRIETKSVPDGQYMLHVGDSYWGEGFNYNPVEQNITMSGGIDVFLGRITLTKK